MAGAPQDLNEQVELLKQLVHICQKNKIKRVDCLNMSIEFFEPLRSEMQYPIPTEPFSEDPKMPEDMLGWSTDLEIVEPEAKPTLEET